MITVRNLKLLPGYSNNDIKKAVSKKLKINIHNIKSIETFKRSLDARRKNDIKFTLTVNVSISGNEIKTIKHANTNDVLLYSAEKYQFIECKNNNSKTVIAGSGPAGLFAAYILVNCGLKPIIIERGEKIENRVKSVENFFNNEVLNEESNVQFGEGGAGTFSDGKLNTGISDKRIRFVLETFVKFGAPKEILYEQKPHIGTDILRNVIINFRNYIEEKGGKFYFSTKLIDFSSEKGKLKSITIENSDIQKNIPCDNLILAIGHSARDTFEMLFNKNVPMAQKPFAVGARIEHTQEFINRIQYGKEYNNKSLPTADYKTAVHLENGRSVYSFCMCPGGYVVAAASEKNMIAVNGMSNYKRDAKNANSALLVNVRPDDFGTSHPLAGIQFQREIESKAFKVSKSYKAPAQTLKSFLYGKENILGSVKPSYKPNVTLCNLNNILPEFIVESLKSGILLIDKKLHGFADENAVLTAPETRSSSPVKILRNENFTSEIIGIFPCGEGAGYAGGITSAAVDGIKVAENIVNSFT